MSYYRTQLEEHIKTLEVRAHRVLDVGGVQLPVKGRVKKWDVTFYDFMDLEQPHEIGRDLPEDSRYFAHDLNEPLPEGAETEGYDMVFALEIMEYIWNPVIATINLANLTVRKGELVVTYPFIYPVHNPVEHDFLRYTENGARHLLEYAGFHVDSVIHRDIKQPDILNTAIASDGMKPARDYPHHGSAGVIIHAIKK